MRRIAFALACLFVVACSGGGGSAPNPNPGTTATPTAVPTHAATATPTSAGPTATPTATPVSNTAFDCPTSDSPASVARGSSPADVFGDAGRHMPHRGGRTAPVADLLAVSYDAGFANGARAQIAAREQRSGVSFVRELSFPHTGVLTRIVKVSGSLDAAAAALRAQAGVRSVARTGYRRSMLSVSAPLLTNDPYFRGFSAAAPLYETASLPGQWDKHVVRLEDAFAYSVIGNGSNVQSANALGSASVKIAMIDTGEDSTHPELASKVVYQRCFVTNPNGVQSRSNFETDPQGHGTDTAGIAATDTGNSLGFAGSGGKAVIYGYRVFPTPDDNCTSDTTTDAQCTSDSTDISDAIVDAVAQHVNVISISLGGGACNGGVDTDPTERNAIADAIAAGIVVVAAAGNDGTATVTAPACDTGVIAAGATGIADGSPNGTGNPTGSSSAPNEYLASYSNFGSPGTALNSATAWGIVAPGGDPSGGMDNDDLHWIENIWTTTPFDSNFAANQTGPCTPDFDSTSGIVDCRVLIAGTSMSTPAVAGAAALIIAAHPTYQSATKMKQLLCATADDINDPNEGCGRLDVYRAMATALGDSSPPGARPVP